MATITTTRRVRPAHGTCRLTLTINGTAYRVRPIPNEGRRAYRFRKGDGTVYDVAETEHGPTCDCPDFTFRRDGIDPGGCKHVKALAACGLLSPARERPITATPTRRTRDTARRWAPRHDTEPMMRMQGMQAPNTAFGAKIQ